MRPWILVFGVGLGGTALAVVTLVKPVEEAEETAPEAAPSTCRQATLATWLLCVFRPEGGDEVAAAGRPGS